MQRLNAINKKLTGRTAGRPIEDSAEWFGFAELMGEKANTLRKRLRPVFESGILNQILPHIENATFPEEVVEILKAQKMGHYFLDGELGNGATAWERATIITEISRVDASAGTLFLVQMKLLARTIELYGSEEQKAYYLPKIRDFEIVGGWGLTEKLNGSDASALTTNVKLVDGQYILNGNKRWIGNANKVNFCNFSNIDSILGCHYCLRQRC
jgi:alkylation response protein AidB-like acyl-CoA dehydrogenase